MSESHSQRFPEHTSEGAVIWIGVTAEELATLPPGTLIVRRDGDMSHLPKDLRGKVVYVEGVEDRTRRPVSEKLKAAILAYWKKLGRDEPPPLPNGAS